jgi:hypothetical protein
VFSYSDRSYTVVLNADTCPQLTRCTSYQSSQHTFALCALAAIAWFVLLHALFDSVHLVMDKTDSSKVRSFCFVEFQTHAQASVAHALYHCTPATTSSRTAACITRQQQINDCDDILAAQDPGSNSGQTAALGGVQAAAAEPTISACSAVPSFQEGAELKVDWADPLRYHIHLHGSIKGPCDAASEHCNVRGRGVSKAGDRVQNSQPQQRPGQQQRAHHHTSHHPPACQRRRAAVPQRPRQTHVFGHHNPRLPPLPSVSSSFLDSKTLSSSSSSSLPTYHQPADYEQQQQQHQLPPVDASSTDPNRLCVNQLNRLQQQLQAEHDDNMARYGFTADSMHCISPLPAAAWASRSTADVDSSSSFYFDGQLSRMSQQRWQQQGLYPLPGGNSGSDSCFLGNDGYWYVPQLHY